ncbi:MAG: amidohydrolase [Alistipes sp.]|jgi:predicted TIM-barrel fold metal-dependent hydrolase|nr:amidohydrolase [Alistipes sp.]
MKKLIATLALAAVTGLLATSAAFGQQPFTYKSKYPDIPIVDVHYHASHWRSVSVPTYHIIPPVTGPDSLPVESFVNVMKVREIIKEKYGSNLGYFVSLNNVKPDEETAITEATGNRVVFAVHAGVTHLSTSGGLNYTPEEMIDRVKNGGYTGVKFWFGNPQRRLKPGQAGITRLDDPRFEPIFSALEDAGVMLNSLHNADPNGPFYDRHPWMHHPVYYWEQIRALENVVARHPKLTIISAHGAWLVCQDAQFDYLRYMLSTYPNLYVDIAATDQYMYLSDRDNIRDFYIEFADRLMFGTDGGRVSADQVESMAERYAHWFALLETDQIVEGGFYGKEPTRGLDLPREVLEKIYYKNAARLYPGLAKVMGLE